MWKNSHVNCLLSAHAQGPAGPPGITGLAGPRGDPGELVRVVLYLLSSVLWTALIYAGLLGTPRTAGPERSGRDTGTAGKHHGLTGNMERKQTNKQTKKEYEFLIVLRGCCHCANSNARHQFKVCGIWAKLCGRLHSHEEESWVCLCVSHRHKAATLLFVCAVIYLFPLSFQRPKATHSNAGTGKSYVSVCIVTSSEWVSEVEMGVFFLEFVIDCCGRPRGHNGGILRVYVCSGNGFFFSPQNKKITWQMIGESQASIRIATGKESSISACVCSSGRAAVKSRPPFLRRRLKLRPSCSRPRSTNTHLKINRSG